MNNPVPNLSLAEHLFLKRAPGAQPDWLADILSQLVWLTDDNGGEICSTLRDWLAGDSEEKAAIALAFDEAFLWETAGEMAQLLDGAQARFPALAAQCRAARERWQAQSG